MSRARRIASTFATGKVPGCAMQMGQMLVFGIASSTTFVQLQNILDLVPSCTWISRPIIGERGIVRDANILMHTNDTNIARDD